MGLLSKNRIRHKEFCGWSLSRLVLQLNQDGFHTKIGKAFTDVQVKRMLDTNVFNNPLRYVDPSGNYCVLLMEMALLVHRKLLVINKENQRRNRQYTLIIRIVQNFLAC